MKGREIDIERKTNNYGMLLHVVCACLHVSVSFVYISLFEFHTLGKCVCFLVQSSAVLITAMQTPPDWIRHWLCTYLPYEPTCIYINYCTCVLLTPFRHLYFTPSPLPPSLPPSLPPLPPSPLPSRWIRCVRSWRSWVSLQPMSWRGPPPVALKSSLRRALEVTGC